MEEFQSTNEHLTQGTPQTKEQLLQGLAQQTPLAAQNQGHLVTRQSSVTPGLRYRNLGKSGLRVSNVGLGTWVTFGSGVTEEQAEEVIQLAYDSGINVFDLSEAYSGVRAELELGRILQRRGWKRSSYIVTTKIYWNTKSDERGLSRKHVIESVKASLARLQLGYIDVVIVHKADPMCPMEEVVRAMNHVINQGWAMYWGTARWTPVEVMEAYTNCRQFNCVTPISEQSEYHMFCREKTELYMPELYNKIGVGLMAWSPLTMGLVSGKLEDGGVPLFARSSFKNKYSSFSWTEDETQANKEGYTWLKERLQPEETRRQQDKLRDISQLADKLGCTVSQLAIAWCLKNESVQCLLLGATSVEQLYESIQSLQLVPKLNTNTMNELERILDNKPIRPPMEW
ncbi:Voltage-gated potassium channel subunit beta-2 [Blattella germanica]|nr:Voltage-gated potassium channel subunit beta-2 [Blattella germanica]